MTSAPVPQVELREYEQSAAHLVHAIADRWAAERPDDAAILNATRGSRLTWSELQRGSMALAAELARMGFRIGDVLAASLPLLNEHILLEFACFRLGVIHAPLDLRLQPAEVIRCLNLIRPKGYFFFTPALGDVVRVGGRQFVIEARVWEHDGAAPPLRLYVGSGHAQSDTSFG